MWSLASRRLIFKKGKFMFIKITLYPGLEKDGNTHKLLTLRQRANHLK
jgi:hypothetical protein